MRAALNDACNIITYYASGIGNASGSSDTSYTAVSTKSTGPSYASRSAIFPITS